MLLDSDVMVDVLRGHAPAVAWLASARAMRLGLPGHAAMEVLQGCRNLADQHRVEKRLLPFTRHWPTPTDCERAYQDFAAYRLSHGLGLIDALIGAHRRRTRQNADDVQRQALRGRRRADDGAAVLTRPAPGESGADAKA